MSDKVKEIEMELKPLEQVCNDTLEYLKHLISGAEEVDPQTILAVAKTFGEIVDAKKDIVEMCYKKQIVEAMEENADEYGETWDEEGPKRYYQRRDSRGRYMSSRGYSEPNYRMMPERDMDRNMGKMYYTETSASRGARDAREGNSGMMRRQYMETKQMHNSNTPEDTNANMQSLEEYTTSLTHDVMDMIRDMTPSEKNMLKTKMQTLASKIN